MPALAQASSLSPPGAPETPTAPMVSLPTLIGSAPCAGTMLFRYRAPAVGLPLTVSANSPDGRRDRARRVGLLHGIFLVARAGPVAARRDDDLAFAAEHMSPTRCSPATCRSRSPSGRSWSPLRPTGPCGSSAARRQRWRNQQMPSPVTARQNDKQSFLDSSKSRPLSGGVGVLLSHFVNFVSAQSFARANLIPPILERFAA